MEEYIEIDIRNGRLSGSYIVDKEDFPVFMRRFGLKQRVGGHNKINGNIVVTELEIAEKVHNRRRFFRKRNSAN